MTFLGSRQKQSRFHYQQPFPSAPYKINPASRTKWDRNTENNMIKCPRVTTLEGMNCPHYKHLLSVMNKMPPRSAKYTDSSPFTDSDENWKPRNSQKLVSLSLSKGVFLTADSNCCITVWAQYSPGSSASVLQTVHIFRASSPELAVTCAVVGL